jgi:hypothetical protein
VPKKNLPKRKETKLLLLKNVQIYFNKINIYKISASPSKFAAEAELQPFAKFHACSSWYILGCLKGLDNEN